MDQSLDDYIGGRGNFSVQISNNKPFGRGKSNFQQRGQRGSIRGRIGINRVQQRQPISVTVPGRTGNFDARDKITVKKPIDARDKLAAKARQTDARVKILNIKAKKGNTSDNAQNNDARAKLTAKRQGSGVQVTFGGPNTSQASNKVGVGNNVMRTINNNGTVQKSTADFQITRTIGGPPASRGLQPGVQTGVQTGVQVSGNNLTITRPVQHTQPARQDFHLTKVVSNIPVHVHSTPPPSLPMNTSHIPVVHNPYQPPPYQYSQPPPPLPPQPAVQPTYYMGVDNTYYDDVEEEEDEDYLSLQDPDPVATKPSTYMVEKTLTVKKPQLLATKSTSNIISLSKTQTVGAKTKVQQQAVSVTSVAMKRKAPVPQSSGPLKLAKTSGMGDTGGGGSKRLKILKQDAEEDDMETDVKSNSNAPLGYRVIVSNLHTVVSQDDIIELFGAIGPMKKARLVKAGVAEVVYTQKGDAQKAIQKYNNRELDGQPMLVKMYSPPAPATPTPKKLTPENIVGNVKDVDGPLRLGKDGPKKGSDLDVSVLHKVLFKAGNPTGTKPVTFTVKV